MVEPQAIVRATTLQNSAVVMSQVSQPECNAKSFNKRRGQSGR